MVLVTSFDQFIHNEKHSSRLRPVSVGKHQSRGSSRHPSSVNICPKLVRRHQRPESRPSLFTPRIPSFGIVASKGSGRVVGMDCSVLFRNRCCTHRNSHSSRGFAAHCCSVTNSRIASATRFVSTPFHCAFASRGCDVRASHGLPSNLGPNEL